MHLHTDQTGRKVQIGEMPQRIVSLVPSITEYLADIKLQSRVVGITKFCIHPESLFKTAMHIGGTKTVQIEKVLSLKPDLILANREENVREQVEALSERAPVWTSDVSTIAESIEMMEHIAAITGAENAGTEWIQKALHGLGALQLSSKSKPMRPRGLYLIWRKPYMAAGTDTFISDVLSRCGFENCLYQWLEKGRRYPELSAVSIGQLNPDLIMLSSEPYPFGKKHIDELAGICKAKVVLVDGEAFSWYGSRFVKRIPYLCNLQRDLTS